MRRVNGAKVTRLTPGDLSIGRKAGDPERGCDGGQKSAEANSRPRTVAKGRT